MAERTFTAKPESGLRPWLQRKATLRIGAPDDAYEREADRAADAVMGGRRLSSAGASLSRIPVTQGQARGKRAHALDIAKFRTGLRYNVGMPEAKQQEEAMFKRAAFSPVGKLPFEKPEMFPGLAPTPSVLPLTFHTPSYGYKLKPFSVTDAELKLTPKSEAGDVKELEKKKEEGAPVPRKCACGGSVSSSLAGECEECKIKRLQKKLSIGSSNDPLEQEADRIADQVMAVSPGRDVGSTAPHMQRFTRQPSGEAGTAPGSVDRVLAGSGKPLNQGLREDMEQRFGYDFSMVRVHTGAEAAQSAQDVNAQAYTVGHNIVFGAEQFVPTSQKGRRLIAHELAHVVQQVSGHAYGVNLQRLSWTEIKEKSYRSIISGIHKARDGMRNGLKKVAAKYLPASLFPIADGVTETAITVIDLLISVVMAVLGIVVGFGEGIVGMITGLSMLIYGVIKILYDLIVGIFTNFDAARQDLKVVWEALKGLPSALKKLVNDWLDEFNKASSERQSLMIGELTGQVLAIIATFAVAAGRAGSAAKVSAATADTIAGTSGEVATTAARAKPVLTVIEGGGSAGGASARAGAGASDIAGNTALKAAPVADPVAPPVRLLPPLPAEAAPAAASASFAPSATRAVATGVGVGAAIAAKEAPKSTKKPKCDGPTGLTKADPIPMTWFKVREDDYYPKRLQIKDRVYGRDDPGNPLKLPLGEPLGVPNRYWPRLNKIMQLVPSERDLKADDFRTVLTKYGFDWSGLQADHVQDLDWGGPDVFENLWPLSNSANMSAGPRQNSHQRITYCETPDGPKVVDQTLTAFKASPGHFGRFFRIAKIER
ncbi:hypothetical protein BURK2_00196 [Burkholderiales bacterium]|nr:hypothetical protein BURK2_00196 [Burkholderiales bacterium]